MKRLRPFRQYWASILTAFALLMNAAIGSHYLANRTQRRKLERRIDTLQLAIDDLKKRDYNSVSSSLTPQAEPSTSTPVVSEKKPRVLGTGRNRTFRYTDIRYPDGYTARYYLRLDPTPEQLHAYVSTLAQDLEDHKEQPEKYPDVKNYPDVM